MWHERHLMRFLGDDGKRALTDAVRALEHHSAVEVVIAVRARSGSYLHADLLAALLGALLCLAVLLFSPWPFGTTWIFVDTVLGAALAGGFSAVTPSVRRWLTSNRALRSAVRTTALATFVEKGICETTQRTGILVYVSQLERRVELVADRGVLAAVGIPQWETATRSVTAVVERGGDANELAKALVELGPMLARSLPVGDDDVNELSDDVSDDADDDAGDDAGDEVPR